MMATEGAGSAVTTGAKTPDPTASSTLLAIDVVMLVTAFGALNFWDKLFAFVSSCNAIL